MREKLEELKKNITTELGKILDLKTLEDVKNRFLGRKGELTQLLRNLKDVVETERQELGQLANDLKNSFEAEFERLAAQFKISKPVNTDSVFDPTLPGVTPFVGHIHPVTAMTHEIWQTFEAMNFRVIAQGPDIEDDWHCFEALNVAKDHPARDMQATFYLLENMVLKTHTSSMQIRYMENNEPPVRIIVSGRTYRRDSDARHTPMFTQFEGLCIDKNITLAHLRGVLKEGLSRLLKQEVDTRFRVSYFPFVEPAAEFDVTCTICGGKGCPTCKNTGWLELGGCGMVHPNVLKNVGYDPTKYQGFAFGFGIERIFMMRHKVADLRLFFENDLRFLQQF